MRQTKRDLASVLVWYSKETTKATPVQAVKVAKVVIYVSVVAASNNNVLAAI